MEKVYMGLDVGSSTCHLVAMTQDGKILVDRKIPTGERPLVEAIEAVPGERHVHLEASTMAGWIRGILKGRVKRVVVSDPKQNAWIAKDARKNDQVDARKLAELLRVGLAEKHEVYYPDEEERAVFKQVVQHYDKATHAVVRLKNQVKAMLRQQGVLRVGQKAYRPKQRKEVLRQVKNVVAREAVVQWCKALDGAVQTQAASRRLMSRESKKYPEIKRFLKMPGVGLVGACRFSGYVQTPERFRNKRKLWRYCRLGVMMRSSDGKPLGRQALDWNGNGKLKDMSRKSFEGAMRKKGDNQFKRTFRACLGRTADKTHARLTTQRKMLAVMLAMWKGGTDYQDKKG